MEAINLVPRALFPCLGGGRESALGTRLLVTLAEGDGI